MCYVCVPLMLEYLHHDADYFVRRALKALSTPNCLYCRLLSPELHTKEGCALVSYFYRLIVVLVRKF